MNNLSNPILQFKDPVIIFECDDIETGASPSIPWIHTSNKKGREFWYLKSNGLDNNTEKNKQKSARNSYILHIYIHMLYAIKVYLF